MRKFPRGKAAEHYMQMIIDAGPDGIAVTEIQRRLGLVQAYNITIALKKHFAAGLVVKILPTGGRPSTLYLAEYAPEMVKFKRTESHCLHKQAEYEAFIRLAGKSGVTTDVIRAHFGVSAVTASERLQQAALRGKVVGLAGFVWGKSHRTKTWFVPEHVPSIVLPAKPKPVERTRSGWAKDQEVIYPEGLKIIHCPPCQLDRYRVDPAIAGRGVISQDYFARRQA